MHLGYADPPYIGCAHLYSAQPDFAGEVDHIALIDRLQSEFDGWVLHAAATPRSIAILAPLVEKVGARLFPGSYAVTRAWKSWQGKFTLPDLACREAAE
jgi:hypothetical protein